MRRIAAAVSALVAVGLGTGVARADVFTGQWDRADQPPTIASPYVTVNTSSSYGLALDIASDLTCHAASYSSRHCLGGS